MSRPETEQPSVAENGDEQHPAFGLIGASRVQNGGAGATLFQSDIRHGHSVVVRVHQAARRRSLNSDFVYAERGSVIEVEMSEAQWASFVSSMNVGDGVPCTIRRQGRETVPELPFQPRLEQSMAEVRDAADRSVTAVQRAFEDYAERKTVANLRTLEFAIKNMPANITFAAKSLSEHAENVVQRARADVEAMVLSKAKQLGLDAAELGSMQLGAGDDDTIEEG